MAFSMRANTAIVLEQSDTPDAACVVQLEHEFYWTKPIGRSSEQ